LARIPLVVFGAKDPRYGACGSVLQVAMNDKLDVSTKVISGVLETESQELLQKFFEKIRSMDEK